VHGCTHPSSREYWALQSIPLRSSGQVNKELSLWQNRARRAPGTTTLPRSSSNYQFPDETYIRPSGVSVIFLTLADHSLSPGKTLTDRF